MEGQDIQLAAPGGQRLHQLNAAKARHLLDYLDKAALTALEAAEAARTAAKLSAGSQHSEYRSPPSATGWPAAPEQHHSVDNSMHSQNISTSPPHPSRRAAADLRHPPYEMAQNPSGTAETALAHAAPHPPSSSAQANSNSIQVVFMELKDKMDRLRFERDALERDKELLLQQLEESEKTSAAWRASCVAAAEAEAKQAQKELRKLQKELHRSTEVARGEKAALVGQVDELSRQLRLERSEKEEEKKRIEAAHATALSLLQAKLQAKERLTREKWREEESKKIKSATLQSLEPDIVLLLQRHKAEKARMEEEFTSVLREKERLSGARERRLEEEIVRLRDTQRQEAADAARRAQRQAQDDVREACEALQLRHEKDLAAAKRSWSREHEMEIDQLHQQLRERDAAKDKDRSEEVARLQQEVNQFRQQYLKDLEKAAEALQAESERKRLAWQESFAAQQHEALSAHYHREAQQQLRQMEGDIRRSCEAERDEAIRTVVDQLQLQHSTALEEGRREREAVRGQLQTLQRDAESQRVAAERVQQRLMGAEQEVEALRQRLREKEQIIADRDRSLLLREEEFRAQQQLQRSVGAAQWEQDRAALLAEQRAAHHEETRGLRAREAQLRQALLESQQAKSDLVAQQHEELQQLQSRIVETVKIKEDVIEELQERVRCLEAEKHDREAWLASQQQMLLQS